MVKIINNDMFKGKSGRSLNSRSMYVLHNDAGSMDAEDYLVWLRNSRTPGTKKAESGFAHYYIDRNTIARVQSTVNVAWAMGHTWANNNSLSYEVVEQFSASDSDFIENENMVLRQMAEDMKFYGDKPNSSNIKFHQEYKSTSCPKRSKSLHGGTLSSLRSYVIDKINYYQSIGDTVQEMLDAEGSGVKVKVPSQNTSTNTSTKETGQTLHLPAGASRWKIYNANGPYTVGNQIHELTPARYGGLSYEIKGNPAPHVYLIDTGVKGRVAIYAGPGTGASISGSSSSSSSNSGSGNKLHLPASASTWRIYNPGGPYTKGNEIHKLTPGRYGGLTYTIKGNPAPDIYLIDTDVKGRVAIYASPGTGATIS